MKLFKSLSLVTLCFITFLVVAQSSNVKVVNSRAEKLENVIDKNEYNARLALRNAKIAYQNLHIDYKEGNLKEKKFEKRKAEIDEAILKGREALKVIYEAKGLLPKK